MHLEIISGHEDIAACNQTATEGAMIFDRMEEGNARLASR